VRFADLGVDVATVQRARPPVRYCVDWSEQRPHLAGPFGAALTTRVFELGWIRRGARRRTVLLTDHGRTELRRLGGAGDVLTFDR
jgi:hypothetical protein